MANIYLIQENLSSTWLAIKFPQIRSLGLLINLKKDPFQRVIKSIFVNKDQQTYILFLAQRINKQKKIKKAFSYVFTSQF